MNSQDCPVSSIKAKIKSSWPYTLVVVICCLVSFWIRTLPSKSVFLPNGFVKFATNDAWYHMRVLNFLLKNYPHRMFYTPWTFYPHGSYIHFGPFFEQMIAIPSLILGFGHPSSGLVDTIGAYLPVVLGVLTVIPVYYIGKNLRGHKTGVIAAILIAIAPGQFLAGSMIGFTHSHVAESFFSTVFMMYFMLALISAKKNNLSFEHVFNKEFNVLKEPLTYSIMAGIMYSVYQLSWTGASLFALIALGYAVFQYILNNLRKESSDYLAIIGISIFSLSTVLLLPSVHPGIGFDIYDYSWYPVVIVLGVMLGFVILSLIEKVIIQIRLNSYYYPLAIFGIGILGLAVLGILSPSLYSTITNAPVAIFSVHQHGESTIGEAASIFYLHGDFNLSGVFQNFTAPGFFVSLLGIFILISNIFRKVKPEEVLTLVWSVFIFFAIYGQNRFAYYYSVNVSILGAYVGSLLLEKVKWDEFDEKFKASVKSTSGIKSFVKFFRVEHLAAVLAIVVILIYPTFGLAMQYTSGLDNPNSEWSEACTWLRSNTTDTGMDFNAIYEPPKNGELFQYPSTAYGVMSWWDYGHYIEVMGHRMPNANPFQQGIGGRRRSINEKNEPGAASFFTAPSEEEASVVLKAIDPRPDKVGARYIMSDAIMATDIFMAMPEWTLDTNGYFMTYVIGGRSAILPADRYYNSMEARLHIFDGNGLKQYRMVHETWADQTHEVLYKQIYNLISQSNIPTVDTGYVKVFEYVKGAKLKGTALPNETIKISTTIFTGQNRTFEYSQSTTADFKGNYEFIVPYSTDGPIPGETQFDTKPLGPYLLSYGNRIVEVRVSEEAVLKGENVTV